MMLTDDYYDILGVPRDASEKDIRHAYRRMIKLYHPDLNPDLPDAENRIRAVLVAYQTLGDRRRRADYDKVMQLFGPRRLRHVVRSVNSPSTVQSSRIEIRKQEAKRPLLSWLIIVMVGLFSVYLWQSDEISYRIFKHWSMTPTIYSSTLPKPSNPATVFLKEPVEDRWYLWYRKFDYQLLRGSYGSARELAEAYVSAGKNVLEQGREQDAFTYASIATATDPTDGSAVELLRTLKRKVKK